MGSTVMVLVIVALGVGVVAAVLVALLSRGVRDDAQDGASAAELVVAEIDAQLTRRAGLTARLAGLAPAGSGKAQSAVARAVTAAEVAAKGSDVDAKLAADGELSAALGRLNDVLDQSEVEAGATLAELRRQLADCEARLVTARQSYAGNRRAR